MREFEIFINQLQKKEIDKNVVWKLDDEWQKYIDRAGWDLTASECNMIIIDYDHYVFSYHLSGMFIFSYNISTDVIKSRSDDWQITDLPYFEKATTLNQNSMQFLDLMDHWCPDNYKDENASTRMIFAFLHALTCIEEYRLKEDGKITEVSDFPKPTFTEGNWNHLAK